MSMLALIIISLIVIGVTTFMYFQNQNEKYHKERLRRKEKTVLMSLSYFFRDTEDEDQLNGVSREFEHEISKLADINGVEINIFRMSGEILTSSDYDYADPEFYKTKVPDPILEELWSTHVHQVKKVDEENVTAYSLLYGKDSLTPIAIVNIPYQKTEVTGSSSVGPFLTTLIEIYVFLLIGASLIAFFLSNYITKSLRTIADKLKDVEINKKNEPLKWKGEDEIGMLVKEYNRMIEQLEASADLLAKTERESAWREMAKQVAHEIKNPLTPMKLSVQHLQRALKPDDPDYEEKLNLFSQKLITQIDALTNIANEFSNFAKMPKSKLEKLNVVQVLKSSMDLFDEHEDVSVHFENETNGEVMINGDREQLVRVFNNIIKNAIQAIPSNTDGNVEITVSTDDYYCKITVKDNGEGIPAEVRDKIFVPNFTTKSSGSGLGLAMVKQIIDAHHGDISFKTSEGEGTAFIVKLPIF
ncbi:sensor histidine kinase [Parvicella tangerina]|uniref:histidine kinase n=1 Tax=Parvicella tangerina TaxID=2829795 RepID=A0A916JKQ3_9FLAO|nr:ATP-binding protein [Parvicella tangerina]CAG5078653.1 Adaptive-response sensory-kinase SasA [Parvicella tangerina]